MVPVGVAGKQGARSRQAGSYPNVVISTFVPAKAVIENAAVHGCGSDWDDRRRGSSLDDDVLVEAVLGKGDRDEIRVNRVGKRQEREHEYGRRREVVHRYPF